MTSRQLVDFVEAKPNAAGESFCMQDNVEGRVTRYASMNVLVGA
jgi:hypothetical protein